MLCIFRDDGVCSEIQTAVRTFDVYPHPRPSAAQSRGPGAQSDCLRNTPLGSGSPVGRPEMWCMTQTPSPEFQTATFVPPCAARELRTECKGPERWATTQYLIERGRPTFRHGILQSRTSALPPDASAASRFDIRSPAFDGRPVVMPDGRTHLIRASTRKVEDFSDNLTRRQERRNRPGRALPVREHAGGTARRPPIKTAHDRPLAWTAMSGLWERI